jgi:hypothetical protein
MYNFLPITKCTQVDNIEILIKVIELEGLDWVHLAQDKNKFQALVDTLMDFRFQ